MSATRRQHVSREAFDQSSEGALRKLKAAGFKRSKEGVAIIEALFAAEVHVTAEELGGRVRERIGAVNVSTVYRMLRVLVEHGLAHVLQFGKGQARFEPAHGRGHHHHLVCTRCGKVVDFVESGIMELQSETARSHGFELQAHTLEIYGLCPRCRRLRDSALDLP